MSSTRPDPIVGIDHEPGWLTVRTERRVQRIPVIWLRDNIPSGRHRAGGQRTFDITVLREPIELTHASLVDGEVHLVFDDGTADVFAPAHLGCPARRSTRRLWDRTLQHQLGLHRYAEVIADPRARLAWCLDLRDLGVALLRGAPTEPDAVVTVTELFGFVRQTNYGITFDVRVEADPNNLAFTSIEIGPHTDNPYRDPVPGIQLLHCLVNDSEGGHTRLTDGFAVVEHLARQDPSTVELLETHPVSFEFVDHPHAHLQGRRPLIERDVDGELAGIRFNTRSAAPFDLDPDALPSFYAAYRLLGRAYTDPCFRIELRLEPGDVIAFDNRRVLHGRSGFAGPRHLVGCYADHDALESTIRVLETALDTHR